MNSKKLPRFLKFVFILPFFLFFLFSDAQTLLPDLTISSGSAGRDSYSRIALDNEGNLYSIGVYSSSPYFNDILATTYGSKNIVLSKYDSNGAFLWAKTIGYGTSIYPITLTLNNEKLLIAGNYRGKLIFIKDLEGTLDTLISNAYYNTFIAEFETDGTLRNSKNFNNIVEIVKIDYLDQNIVFCGTFNSNVEFDHKNPTDFNTIYSAGNSDLFIACLDPNFNFLWGKRAGGPSLDDLYDMDIYNDEIYVTGSFVNNMNFNTPSSANGNVLSAYGYGDIFIAKYDKYGNPQWIKRAGSSYDDNDVQETGTGIFVNKRGLYVIGSGFFQSHFNGPFDTTFMIYQAASFYNSSQFLAHYAHNGSIKWVKELNNNYVFYPPLIHGTDYYIVVNENFRNSFTDYSSYYQDSINFYARGSFDQLLRLFDFNGNFITGAAFGCTPIETVYDILVSKNQIYLSGSFSELLYFNDGYTAVSQIVSRGLEDIFIARYPFPEFIQDTIEIPDYSLKLFPNPADKQITITITTDQIGVKYFLYDVIGRIVTQGELSQNENTIDVSNLNAGIFLVKIMTTKPKTIKFIKY